MYSRYPSDDYAVERRALESRLAGIIDLAAWTAFLVLFWWKATYGYSP